MSDIPYDVQKGYNFALCSISNENRNQNRPQTQRLLDLPLGTIINLQEIQENNETYFEVIQENEDLCEFGQFGYSAVLPANSDIGENINIILNHSEVNNSLISSKWDTVLNSLDLRSSTADSSKSNTSSVAIDNVPPVDTAENINIILNHSGVNSSSMSSEANTAIKSLNLRSSTADSSKSNTSSVAIDNVPPAALPRKHPKRRKALPSQWKSNVRHMARMKGAEYINVKGQTTYAKEPKIMEDCRCRFNCHVICPPERQEEIFRDYYNLGDIVLQKAYLNQLIIERNIQRTRPRKNIPKKAKSCSREYYMANSDGTRSRVCQKFFCLIFQISDKVIHSVISKRSPTSGIVHANHGNSGRVPNNKTTDMEMELIKTHIDSFVRFPGHYNRKTSKVEYLSPDLSISIMYRLYCEQSTAPVSYDVYQRVFKAHDPPLSFCNPKKNSCTLCLQYTDRNDDTIDDALSRKYNAHKNRVHASFALKKKTMEDKNVQKRTITFDLEAILLVPQASNSELYYSRKLSVYNFTIYDNTTSGYCYMWDEVNGKKASSEIFTCLFSYIRELPSNVKHLTTWSDTCAGQNRNKYLLAAMVYIVNSPATRIEKLDVMYLESGHSMMECDSMHSLVERSKKNKRIYTPGEMRVIVEGARMKPTPFKVRMLDYTEFRDFKTLFDEIMNNSSITTTGKKVEYLKIKRFQFNRGSDEIQFKYDYGEEGFEVIKFLSDPNSSKRKRTAATSFEKPNTRVKKNKPTMLDPEEPTPAPPARKSAPNSKPSLLTKQLKKSKKGKPAAALSAESSTSTSTKTVPKIAPPPPPLPQRLLHPELIIPKIQSGKIQLKQLHVSKLPISIAKKKDLMKLLKNGVIPAVYYDYFNSLSASKDVVDTFPYFDQMREEEIEIEEVFFE